MIQCKMLGQALDVFGQVGVKQRIDRAGAAHRAFNRQAQFLDDLGAGAIRADEETAPNRVLMSGQPVPQGGCHAGCVLDMRQVLGVEGDLGAAGSGALHQYRLHIWLRDVEQRAWTALQVVPDPVRAGAPGPQPRDFYTGQACREQSVAHEVPW